MTRLAAPGTGAALGAVGALLYVSVLTDSPGALILAYLAQLPLFAAGLWLGLGAGIAAGVAALLVVSALTGLATAGVFAALYVAPIVFLVRQALLARPGPGGVVEWYPPGLLTAWLTALGLVALGTVVVFLGGPSGVETLLGDMLAPLINRFADESGSSREALTRLVALVTPGAIAASWMAMTASNGVLAQGILARFGKAWRPSPDLAALTLPNWVSGLLAVAVALLVFGGEARFFGANGLIVLSVPFCLAGLAVLHTVARRLSRPQVPLAAFYVVAGLLGWPLLLIAIVGVLDAPLGLRRRFAPSPPIGGRFDD